MERKMLRFFTFILRELIFIATNCQAKFNDGQFVKYLS